MEYRPDKKSIVYFLLKRSLLITLLLGTYHFIFGIVISLIYSVISYNLYVHMSVFLNHNFLIINGMKKQKLINLNNLVLQKYYRKHRNGYWFMGKYREFDSSSSLPIHKVLWFKYNDGSRREKNVILNFLSNNDFIDIKRRIYAHQNQTDNINLQNIIEVNTKPEIYVIDREKIEKSIDKIYNKCFLYTMLSLILFILVLLAIYLSITHTYSEVIYNVLYVFIFGGFSFIGLKFCDILAWNHLRQIKNKFVNRIIIEDKIVIDNKIIEFGDIKNIYTNTYSDFLENEIKCLVISTDRETYTCYLDYIIDNDENFIYFSSFCNNLQKIFGSLYSNNNV